MQISGILMSKVIDIKKDVIKQQMLVDAMALFQLMLDTISCELIIN